MTGRRLTGAVALLLATAGGSAALVGQSLPADPPPQRATSVGALCLWSIVAGMADTGRRCGSAADPGFQQSLEESEAALDRYATANGGFTAEKAARFKQLHALVGGPPEAACSGDPRAMYDHLRKQGADALRRMVRDVTARPGKLEWGDCL